MTDNIKSIFMIILQSIIKKGAHNPWPKATAPQNELTIWGGVNCFRFRHLNNS